MPETPFMLADRPLRPEGCVFCEVLAIRSSIEWLYAADSSEHMVFEPLNPVTPGHLLVVPVTHVQDATENPHLTAMAAGVAARVAMRYRSANIITSIGVPATQSITHLHWHVVPRRDDDGLHLPWTGQHIAMTQGEEVEMGLRKHGEGEILPEVEHKTASQTGMTAEARQELQQENDAADGAHDE